MTGAALPDLTYCNALPDLTQQMTYQTHDYLPDPATRPEFYASVPAKRLIAWVIDLVVVCALMIPILFLTLFTALFFWPLAFAVVGFVYRVATIAGGSATWGMRFVGIELRDAYGARLNGGQALAHTAGYTVSMALPILQVISILMMLTGSRAQGLTDAVLGTVALNRRAYA